ALDLPGGPGVEEITYSASGAHTIASTMAPGTSTTILITTEGQTMITFFATNHAGISEAPRHITVKLDKTPPRITGARNPASNTSGWNNTNVTVSFTCADTLSGVLSCSEPTTLAAEGANQSVTGTATDLAGNSMCTTVSGINIDKTPPV